MKSQISRLARECLPKVCLIPNPNGKVPTVLQQSVNECPTSDVLAVGDLEDAVEGVPLLAVIGSRTGTQKRPWFGGLRNRFFPSNDVDDAVAA